MYNIVLSLEEYGLLVSMLKDQIVAATDLKKAFADQNPKYAELCDKNIAAYTAVLKTLESQVENGNG